MHFVPTAPEFGVPIILSGVGVGIHGLVRKSFFSPLHLYFFVHLIALGFSILQLFWTTNNYDLPFYLVISATYLTFATGCWLGMLQTTEKSREIVSVGKFDMYWAAAGIASLFLLSRLAGGWPMLVGNPTHARMTLFSSKFMALLFEIGMLGGMIAAAGLVLSRKWYYAALLLIVIAEILLTGNRGQALLFFFFALCLHETVRKHSIFKYGIATAVTFGVLFTVVGVIRAEEKNHLQEAASLFNSLKMFYMYLCNGYWNFNVGIHKVIDGQQGLTFGLSSFGGLWYWLFDVFGMQKSLGWDTVFNETTVRYYGLNSSCYMWPLTKDFGLVGMLFVNAGIGYFLARVYKRAEFNRTAAYCYAYFSYVIFSGNNLLWTAEGLSTLTFILLFVYVKVFGQEKIS